MSDLNGEFLGLVEHAPAYCITVDLDWAPESMIVETLNIFDDVRVPVTPFLTHASRAIANRYSGVQATEVGVHPNFRAGSTHGDSPPAVIDHVVSLWPAARCFRSHSFVDSSEIASAFFARGFRFDSNLCLHLQPGIVPLRHSSGLVRFPVFLEDDVWLVRGRDQDVRTLAPQLRTPGLKIFNFHPQLISVNAPDPGYYRNLRNGRLDDWAGRVHRGPGVRTFLIDLLGLIRDSPGLGIFSLTELYDRVAAVTGTP